MIGKWKEEEEENIKNRIRIDIGLGYFSNEKDETYYKVIVN